MNTEDIKKMALALQAVQEASKKKLDPVGKEDGDIDNDGDKDKSDEYLHARRKAVSAAIKGKSMKEEEDRSKLDTFIKNMDGNKLYPATKKRPPTQHVMKAKKDVQKEEVELDEVSTATLQRYKSAASKAMDRASDSAIDKMLGSKDSQSVDISKEKKTMDKRSKGYSLATKKLTKEEAEELDELSKETLGSYVKKASRNLAGREYKRGAEKDASTANLQKSYKRDMGISKAVDKMTKEEVDLDEAVNERQIKKDIDSGMSHDAVIGKHANKKLTNTDEIRKVIQQHAWNKRMKKEEVDEAKLTDKQVKAALSAAKAKPKDKVSLKPAPWDKKDMKESRWPIYNRIQEAKDAHLKSATAPEAIDSKASKGEKDFVNLHGGLKGNDSGIDGAKAALQTAQSIVAKIKANPKPGGDRNIIKSTEAK